MKKEGLNKRGQGLTIGTVILIILGITVLVFLIIGFSQGWDLFFGKFELTPSALETTAQACQGYAMASLKFDYCKLRKVEKNTYVNCEFSMIQNNYPDAVSEDINCTVVDPDNLVNFCNDINEDKREKVEVNGDSCSDIFGATNADDAAGTPPTEPATPPENPS